MNSFGIERTTHAHCVCKLTVSIQIQSANVYDPEFHYPTDPSLSVTLETGNNTKALSPRGMVNYITEDLFYGMQ
jgi:hypothetical protein